MAARLIDINDQRFQAKVMEDLANLPFDNLWLRVSMTSPDIGPTNARRLIRTLAGWHNIGVPIVMDHVGGLTGEALLAMNVASGIAHGYCEQTSFTTTGWCDPPEERDKDEDGGRATRIGLTALGRTFTSAELEVLLSAHGAKSALLPNDRKVLPNGLDDLRNDPRRFNAAEAQRRVAEIASTPTANRPDQFANRRMREIVATAKKQQNSTRSLTSRKRTMSIWRSCGRASSSTDKRLKNYGGLTRRLHRSVRNRAQP